MTNVRSVDMGLPVSGLVLAGIISLSSVAFGADSKTGTAFPPCTTVATDADRKAAQGAFAAGQGSFNESDYSTAITYWRDAYRRDCSAHALLLNLARAYELKGEKVEAVNALETYLQRKPDAADAEQVRRRIENLKSQMAAAAPQPATPPVVTPAASAVPVSSTAAAPSAPPTMAPADSVESSPSRSKLPLFVAGGGGVLAVVGAVVLVGGIKKVQDAEADCPEHKCPLTTSSGRTPQEAVDLGNEGRKQELGGGLLLGVGVAAAGAGLLWYFLTPPPSTASSARATTPSLQRATVLPAVGPGYAGLAFVSGF